MKILYTSDIHASDDHLFSLLKIAKEEEVESIIVGGDIIPHHLPNSDRVGLLQAQAEYLRSVLIPTIKDFKQKRNITIYLDFSNDDFICNRKILEGLDGELINLLHMRRHKLTDDVDIIGYMIVPPTPFQRKDWEKPDSLGQPYARDNIISLDGYTSSKGMIEKTVINPASKNNIENDLAQLSETIDHPFIFVSHCPPYDTPLDILDNGLHVGSLSIRKFIKEWSKKGKLIASFHGHIHGSPNRSGSISTNIEDSTSINPGQNEGEGVELRHVIFETTDKQSPLSIRIVKSI